MIDSRPDPFGNAKGGQGPLASRGRCDMDGDDGGMAALSVDADGEVAQAGHIVREMASMDLGVILAERAVADVVQTIFDLPVPSDALGKLGTVSHAGQQAGDRETRSMVSLPVVKSALQRTTCTAWPASRWAEPAALSRQLSRRWKRPGWLVLTWAL